MFVRHQAEITVIGMCHFLPVHHFGMACLAGSKVNIQHFYLVGKFYLIFFFGHFCLFFVCFVQVVRNRLFCVSVSRLFFNEDWIDNDSPYILGGPFIKFFYLGKFFLLIYFVKGGWKQGLFGYDRFYFPFFLFFEKRIMVINKRNTIYLT